MYLDTTLNAWKAFGSWKYARYRASRTGTAAAPASNNCVRTVSGANARVVVDVARKRGRCRSQQEGRHNQELMQKTYSLRALTGNGPQQHHVDDNLRH